MNRAATYYKIAISDNGIGFEQQYAKQIFSLFKRLHSNESYGGSGVGLSLCKKIVGNHNGEIFATAAVDQGATFTLILPMKHAPLRPNTEFR